MIVITLESASLKLFTASSTMATECANRPTRALNPASSTFVTIPITLENRKQYFTRQEVCERLHISTSTFYRLASIGKINILKLEGRTLVDADEFDAAVRKRQLWRYNRY